MVDRWDEPLHLRCKVGTGAEEDKRVLKGLQLALQGKAANFSIGNLFSVLHLQPFDNQLKRRGSTGLINSLIIPETVAFKSGDPAYPVWYLSSKSDPGTIKRKNKDNVTPHNIVEAFTRRGKKRSINKGMSGIVAVLVGDAKPNPGISMEDQCGEAVIEYLDDVGLRYFLDHRVASFSGILQQWVDPKGNHNSLLHCVWSRAMCHVTCKTNSRALTDKRVGVYERAVTFEGADNLVEREPVSSQTHAHVERVCAGMAKHVSAMTDGNCTLSTFSSYWKVRSDGKIVFLWCSSLRSSSSTPTSSEEGRRGHPLLPSRPFSPVLSVPLEIDSKVKEEKDRPYACPISNMILSESDARHFVTYKMIIAEHDAMRMYRETYQGAAGPSSAMPKRPSSASFRPSSGRNPRQPPPGEAPPAGVPRRPTSASMQQRVCSGGGSDGSKDGQGGGVGIIPPLIAMWERLSDEAIYKRLTSDAGFLYTKVRVSEAVAKRFSAFVETADELDEALAPLGGGHGVAMVPNNAGREGRVGKQSRSESPFVDILGDGDEDDDEDDRLHEGEGGGGRGGGGREGGNYELLAPPPLRQIPPVDLTGAALSARQPLVERRRATNRLSLPTRITSSVTGPRFSQDSGRNSNQDDKNNNVIRPTPRSTGEAVRLRKSEALERHAKRVRDAPSKRPPPKAIPPPGPRPQPPQAARGSTGEVVQVLGEWRRGRLNMQGAGSLKALVPKLRLEREKGVVGGGDAGGGLTERGPAKGEAVDGEAVRERGSWTERVGRGGDVGGWQGGSRKEKQLRRLVGELESRVSNYSKYALEARDVMRRAREELSLPPLPAVAAKGPPVELTGGAALYVPDSLQGKEWWVAQSPPNGWEEGIEGAGGGACGVDGVKRGEATSNRAFEQAVMEEGVGWSEGKDHNGAEWQEDDERGSEGYEVMTGESSRAPSSIRVGSSASGMSRGGDALLDEVMGELDEVEGGYFLQVMGGLL